MSNFCGVISNKPKDIKPEKCFTFPVLHMLTCKWSDETEVLADTFQRHTWKVTEREAKVLNIKDTAASCAQLFSNCSKKLDMIEQELTTTSFNLDILELFVQHLEHRVPEINPCNVDCQRFPMFEALVSLLSCVDNVRAHFERFSEEYDGYIAAYRQRHVITTILDYHIRILQNMTSELENLEQLQQSTEKSLATNKNGQH